MVAGPRAVAAKEPVGHQGRCDDPIAEMRVGWSSMGGAPLLRYLYLGDKIRERGGKHDVVSKVMVFMSMVTDVDCEVL
jgi:hypothetical protein